MSKGHAIDASWLGCIDWRLRSSRDAYIDARFPETDPVLLAGGALGLASLKIDPNGENARQLNISVSLHSPQQMVLEAHFDCGAVREFLGKIFSSDAEEREFLMDKLREAAEFVRIEFPKAKIVGVLATPGQKGSEATFEEVNLFMEAS